MKKGFTLVELIATIAILSIIVLISSPSILKSYNESREKAMVIQETKLIEAGDILLDDYCNDALDEEKKEKCSEYYQRLYSVSGLKDEVNYNYICVRDLKKLKYYSEKLVYGGSDCQGVVVYETDKKTNLKVDSYSFIDCEGAYTSQNANNMDFMNLFKECFDSNITEEEEDKTYTITIKYVEDNLYGKQIRNSKVIKVDSETYKKDIKGTFNITTYTKYGNNYGHAINHIEGVDVEYVSTDSQGTMTYNITKMPKQDITIIVVYSVLKYDIVTNYYFYDNNTNLHSGKSIKESKSVTGYTFETVKLDVPETLTSKVNGKDELFNLKFKKVDGVNVNSDISKDEMDIGTANKIVDYIYQRDEFDITYDNRGGEGCTTGRVKYLGNFENLCTPKRKGYTFNGWKKNLGDEEYIINGKEYKDYSDVTLIADWSAIKYTLVFNGNNSTSGKRFSKECTYDQECVFPNNIFSKTGYNFDQWYLNANQTGTAYEPLKSYKNLTSKSETINIYAGWNPIKYYISFDSGGGSGSMKKMELVYSISKNLTKNSFVKVGYKFASWKDSNNTTYQDEETVVNLTDKDGVTINLTANWDAINVKYVVNHYQQKINMPEVENNVNYTLKETEELTAKADSTKKISVKKYTGFTSPSEMEVKINADGTTVVNYYYKRNKYKVTLEKDSDTIKSVSGDGTYYYGEEISIKAVVKEYHEFVKWTDEDSETSVSNKKEYVFKVSSKDVTLKAYGKKSKIEQALYVKKTDDNPYSLIFIKSDTHYQKGDTYKYVNSSGENVKLLVHAVYRNFINDDYNSEDEVDWKNIAPYVEVVRFHSVIKPKSTAYWFANFEDCKSLYLDRLDTSNVTNMKYMFYKTGSSKSLTGQTFKIDGLDDFDTTKVTNMSSMFNKTGRYAKTFNIGNLRKKEITTDSGDKYVAWNTKNVKYMQYMFFMSGLHAESYELGNISNWNVGNVIDMRLMFAYSGFYSEKWNIGTLSSWDTSNVESMNQMFNQAGAYNFAVKNLNLKEWNVTKVVDKNDFEHDTYTSKKWPQYCWFENGNGVRNREGIIAPESFKITNYDKYCYPVSSEKHQENIN